MDVNFFVLVRLPQSRFIVETVKKRCRGYLHYKIQWTYIKPKSIGPTDQLQSSTCRLQLGTSGLLAKIRARQCVLQRIRHKCEVPPRFLACLPVPEYCSSRFVTISNACEAEYKDSQYNMHICPGKATYHSWPALMTSSD